MCHAAKKANMPCAHCEYIEKKKEKSLFHACIAPWALLQNTPFLHYSCPLGRVGHTANLIKFAAAICEIKFQFNFFVIIAGQGL